MNQADFVRNMMLAGQMNNIVSIVQSIERAYARGFAEEDELRDASYRYLCVCTDHTKLYGFLSTCSNMNRSYCSSWDASVLFVCGIVAGWAP
jgi:hypothetical protein